MFTAEGQVSPVVCLHSTGPEDVYGFLAELDRHETRNDTAYKAAARFAQIASDILSQSDNADVPQIELRNGPPTIDVEAIAALPTDLSEHGLYVVNLSGGGPLVRRFSVGGNGLREWTAQEVEDEAVAAASAIEDEEWEILIGERVGPKPLPTIVPPASAWCSECLDYVQTVKWVCELATSGLLLQSCPAHQDRPIARTAPRLP